MGRHKRTYDWTKFQGSAEALKWNQRDLASIDEILAIVPGRTLCVQAGGNLGIFPKYLARSFASVLTFEPSPALFPKLTRNAPESNVVRIQAALGDAPGLIGVECTRRGDKPGLVHEGLTHVAGDGIVPRLRLDDFALPNLDLLYLDLEGYELFALRGAIETIRRCRPVVAVEINRNIGFYGFTGNDVRESIRGLGYTHALTVHSDEVYVPCR